MDINVKRLLWFALALFFVVAIPSLIEAHMTKGEKQGMIEACGTACDGQVKSFEFDWTHDPVCICK